MTRPNVVYGLFAAVAIAGLASVHAQAQTPAAPPSAAANPAQTPWIVPDVDKLPDDDWGRTVRYGRDLVSKPHR